MLSTGACDCNDNGIDDADDIASGFSEDCNGNGRPDACEIPIDSPAPGGPWYCVTGCAPDCNGNGLPDACDIAEGAADCNGDGVPDACQLDAGDCNADGVLDACQLAEDDCNGNGILDSCEPPFFADAGEDFLLCAGRTSNPLGGPVVAGGSTPGYTYAWSITAGPMNGGELINPAAPRPQFTGSLPGLYTIHLLVTDSTGCMTEDELTVEVYEMSVDAGPDLTVCAAAQDIALNASVTGGIAPFQYAWTIEPGSASLDPTQFGGDGPSAPTPTFSPQSPGVYVLKVTVTDDNDRSCVLTDTLRITAATLRLEGTSDFALCAGGTSPPLNVTVASGGTPPFDYAWSIEPGSADSSLSQFGAGGHASRNPTFSPTTTGVYRLRATVTDSSQPPCVDTHDLTIVATTLAVEAGNDAAICLDSGGIQLSPTMSGGAAPLFFQWSISADSPSTSNLQFPNQSGLHPNWIFTPTAPGAYTLTLTVTDSATPPCVTKDTLVIRASRLNVDAGPDLVIQAFEPSPALGALPVVVGAAGIVAYDWRVIAGPSLDRAQFNNPAAERPVFTPSAVGRYALELVASAESGCARSDSLIVDAITDRHEMPVNAQGRAFYELQVDVPHSRAIAQFHDATPGALTSAAVVQPSNASPFTRRLVVEKAASSDAFILLVGLYLSAGEQAALPAEATVLRWIDAQSAWRAAGDRPAESGLYPARPTRQDLGRTGYDAERGLYWAVTDVVGTFTLGTPETAAPVTDAAPSLEPLPSADLMAPMCGLGAASMALMLPGVCIIVVAQRRQKPSRKF